MNPLATPIPMAARLALLLGAALLAFTTYRAVRAREGATSFGWAIVAGLACSVLAMAAALRRPESLGLAAALAQLLTVLLAAALGWVCAPVAGSSESGGGRFGPAGRMLAWLALIGLPPTPGFHAKLLLYRALLLAGWPWALGLTVAASWVLLLPALQELRTLHPGSASRTRRWAVAALLLLLLILGLAPYLWLPGTGSGPVAGTS